MLKSTKKIIPLVLLGSGFIFVNQANAACYIDSNTQMMRQAHKPTFKLADTTITNSLKLMDKTVAQAVNQQADIITAALKTLVQQKALGATQVSNAIVKNTELEMAAEDAKELADNVREVQDQYGPRGSGVQPCKVYKSRKETQLQQIAVQNAVPQMVRQEVTARPGKYAEIGKQMATRLELHNKLYCTADQAASGLCEKEGPRAGKSLTAETMFTPAKYGSHEYNDKSALINNMAGFADAPLTAELSETTGGQAYADNKRRKDSITSTAINYLKGLQAYWSGVNDPKDGAASDANSSEERQKEAVSKNKKAEGSGTSKTDTLVQDKTKDNKPATDKTLAEKMKSDVDRYFGSGDDYKKWSQGLVGLNERGVLTEILQIKALKLKLAADEYDELMKQEAMLAAYVSAVLSNSDLEKSIAKKHNEVLKNAGAGYGR